VFDGNHPPEFPKNVKHVRYSLGCALCYERIDYTQSANLVKKKLHNAYQTLTEAAAAVTFCSFETVKELLKLEMEKFPQDSKEWNFAAYLTFFMEESANYTMSKHLYLFVHFYNWLQTTMAYRLSQDEIALTAVEIIRKLPKNTAAVGLHLLQNFVDAWNDMRRQFVEFHVCEHAREHQEGVIPELSFEDTRLIDLLSIDGENGLIFRMLEGRLVYHQNSHFQQKHLKALLGPGAFGEDDIPLNRFEVLCDKLPEDFDLRFLSKYKSPLSTEVISVENVHELADLSIALTKVIVERDDVSGNLVRHTQINQRAIARFILKNYISGRHCFTMQKLMFPFPGRLEDTSIAASGDTENLSLQLDKQLGNATMELYVYWKFLDSDFVPQDLNRQQSNLLETRLQKCSEEDAPEVISAVLSAVRLMRNKVASIDEMKATLENKLELVFNEVLATSNFKFSVRAMFRDVGRLPNECLFAVSKRLCDWFFYQEFLFSDLGQDFCDPLSTQIVALDELIELSIGGSIEIAVSSLKILQASAEILLNNDIRQLLRNFHPNQPFSRIARNKFDSLELTAGIDVVSHATAQKFREIINSSDLEVRNYAYLMRFVRKLCGDLAVYITTYNPIQEDVGSDYNGRKVYKEKVPEDYELIQECLPGSEAVEEQKNELYENSDDDYLFCLHIGDLLVSDFDASNNLSIDQIESISSAEEPQNSIDPIMTDPDVLNLLSWVDTPSPDVITLDASLESLSVGLTPPPVNDATLGVRFESESPELTLSGLSLNTSVFDDSVFANSPLPPVPLNEPVRLTKEVFCKLAGIDLEALEFLESQKIVVRHMLRGKLPRYNKDDVTKFTDNLVCFEDQHLEFETDFKIEKAKSLGLQVISQTTESKMKSFVTLADWEHLVKELQKSQVSIILSREDILIRLGLSDVDFDYLGLK
jgi:hypothetical protein